ncbi:MAG: cyclic nucleotide-binding domain-containing protein [Anaerolineales bacterium]|nr:cyclic nucleotide-binding domain-containing protein [Anaerolineales bacterium]
MTTKIETLKQFDVFAELPKQALEKITPLTLEETHADGALLFEEGAPAEKIYLILEGKVSLEKRVQLGRTGTPRRATLSVICAGHTVGWSSLVPPFVYTSSGICLEDSTLLAILGVDLRDFMRAHPEVGLTVYQQLASIIRGRMTNATAMLTYFLSIVSHELKRPLAAVENYLQILSGGYAGELSPKQKRLIERSTLRVSDLRNLISDILDFARMQPDQIRADFEELDPAEIGAEALEEVRLAATQKDIRLKVIGPTEYKPIVAARRRLRQVISNLLANAVKFSPEGSTVTLSAHDTSDSLVIEVMDEGIGIPEEDQEHIFDDFFRASNAVEFGGAGLGLSIAKKIVDAHSGSITVESPCQADKSGTKFTVVIPRKPALPGERTTPEANIEDENLKQSEGVPHSAVEGGEA